MASSASVSTPSATIKLPVSRAAGGAADEGAEALVFSVAPAKVLAFAKGTFSHTRHRF